MLTEDGQLQAVLPADGASAAAPLAAAVRSKGDETEMRALAMAVRCCRSTTLFAQSPKAPREGWAGRWRADDAKLHATLAIADVDAKGFAVEWDEGVGDQGVREKGTATWIAGGARASRAPAAS